MPDSTLPAPFLRGVLLSIALVALVTPTVRWPLEIVDTSIFIIEGDKTEDEDLFVAATSGIVEGDVDGDLTIVVSGSLAISGNIAGDLLVLSGGTVTISGVVTGDVRGAARAIVVEGRVNGDMAVAAVNIVIAGDVGRDMLAAGGTMDLGGGVGRDLRGWFASGRIDGAVGHDVDISVQTLTVGPRTDIGGDLLYRADREATASAGAVIGGQSSRLSTRGPFVVRLYLTLALAAGFLLFLALGIIVLWLFRSSTPKAAAAVVTRPWRTLTVGFVAAIGLPLLLIAVIGLVAPFLAKVVALGVILIVLAMALVLGPIPAFTAAGNRLTRGRAGLFGGFVVGAVGWRLASWLVPTVGAILSLAALTWGVGGWIVAGWEQRSRTRPADLFPGAMVVGADEDDDDGESWEPPLPPLPRETSRDDVHRTR